MEISDLIGITIRLSIILVVGMLLLSAALRALNFAGERAKIPGLILQPLRTVVKVVLFVVVIGVVAGLFGIDVMNLVTATLAMIAIGFVAVWSMASNVTATFFLVITKPFNVGDHIQFAGDETQGEVTDVNLFYTTLTTADGNYFQIPNNMFFQRVIKRRKAAVEKKASLGEQLGVESRIDIDAGPAQTKGDSASPEE